LCCRLKLVPTFDREKALQGAVLRFLSLVEYKHYAIFRIPNFSLLKGQTALQFGSAAAIENSRIIVEASRRGPTPTPNDS